MPSATAHVATDRPSRYLVQLCRHLANNGRHLTHRRRTHHRADAPSHPATQARVEWSATDGSADFGWAHCTLRAADGLLTLRAEADDEQNLQHVQNLLTEHLDRFARRNPLTVHWEPTEPRPAPGV